MCYNTLHNITFAFLTKNLKNYYYRNNKARILCTLQNMGLRQEMERLKKENLALRDRLSKFEI